MGSGCSQDEVLPPADEQGKERSPGHQRIKNVESGAVKIAPEVKLPPHNYEEILKDADASVDRSSIEKLYDQLYAGVFLSQNKKASNSVSHEFQIL